MTGFQDAAWALAPIGYSNDVGRYNEWVDRGNYSGAKLLDYQAGAPAIIQAAASDALRNNYDAYSQFGLMGDGGDPGTTPGWAASRFDPASEVAPNFLSASDQELRGLGQAAGGGWDTRMESVIAGRAQQAQIANDAYRTQLGGNYAGGTLPDGGYRPPYSGFSTGNDQSQSPAAWGVPGQGFSGWGGPGRVGGLGGINGVGGLGGWGGPFSNNNPWGASS